MKWLVRDIPVLKQVCVRPVLKYQEVAIDENSETTADFPNRVRSQQLKNGYETRHKEKVYRL